VPESSLAEEDSSSSHISRPSGASPRRPPSSATNVSRVETERKEAPFCFQPISKYDEYQLRWEKFGEHTFVVGRTIPLLGNCATFKSLLYAGYLRKSLERCGKRGPASLTRDKSTFFWPDFLL